MRFILCVRVIYVTLVTARKDKVKNSKRKFERNISRFFLKYSNLLSLNAIIVKVKLTTVCLIKYQATNVWRK